MTTEGCVVFNSLIKVLTYLLFGLIILNVDWPIILFFTMVILGEFIMNTCRELFGCFKKHFIKNTVIINHNVLPKLYLLIVGVTFATIFRPNMLFCLFTLAVLFNVLPIILNGGMMPILPGAFIKKFGRLYETDADGRIIGPYLVGNVGYCYATTDTRMAFLGDNLCAFDSIVSIGDLFLLIFFIYSVIYQIICLLKPA